jgi:hypothetical protein
MKLEFLNRIRNLLFIYSGKWWLKIFLLLSASIIVIGAIAFVNLIVGRLIEKEKKLIQASATVYKSLSQNLDNPNASSEDLFEILEELQSNITFPVITTNEDDDPNYPFNTYSYNIDLDTSLSTAAQRTIMKNYVSKMKENYDPILIKDRNDKILMKMYYTNSTFLDFLTYFPYVAILAVILFLLFSFGVFNNIRRNQESLVWVGMSKEAAHQLGTPLSSILAWLEILNISDNVSGEDKYAVSEMKKDVERLNIIANRFSKIGSKPELKRISIADIMENTRVYFEKRLPQIGRKVHLINKVTNENLQADINEELFVWVIENLIKNAAESIETPNGVIEIKGFAFDRTVNLTIKDNGKGMSNKVKNQIFNPGFTTKKRGWGLGLSLCKRIIEQYHKGRIYVKQSAPGEGTTFQIELPTNSN